MDMRYIVGIDEVGRGPLAGPVTVCAVHWISDLKPEEVFGEIRDSKKLAPKRREELAGRIVRPENRANLRWSARSVGAGTIDRIGIARALAIAAEEAIQGLDTRKEIRHIHADYGLPIPKKYPGTSSVRGDESNPVIALASVVAKVTRDRMMVDLAERYPQYGFGRNKGYGTKEHRESIRANGITAEHRKTFLRNICYNPKQETRAKSVSDHSPGTGKE